MPIDDLLTPEEICEIEGHEWVDAGGGLELCVYCDAERWADSDPLDLYGTEHLEFRNSRTDDLL